MRAAGWGDGAAIGATTESHVRVRYAETDRMDVAYHAEYLVWFEVGRTDWLRGGGFSYRSFEELGYRLPVIEASCKYHHPARYDDELVVRTALAQATRVRIGFDYEVVRRADGRRLAVGRSVHAVTDTEGRLRRLPPELLERIRQPATSGAPEGDQG